MREHPERFFAAIGVDPNHGMEAVRKIERYATSSISSASGRSSKWSPFYVYFDSYVLLQLKATPHVC